MSQPSGDTGSQGLDISGMSGNLGSEGTDAAEQQGAQSAQQGQGGSESQAHGVSQAEGMSAPDQSQTSTPGHNPKWDKMLGKIPTEFHNIVADDLKQWDRNYGALAQQYAPWKQLVQQGITPEQASKAYQLYQTINMNPMEIYRRLGEALKDQLPPQDNRSQQQVTQQQQQGQQGNAGEYEVEGQGNSEVTSSPEFQALQQQYNQLYQMVQGDISNRQLEQQTQSYEAQIEQTFQQIEAQNGPFDRADVLQRLAAQLQMGQEPNILKAYQDQQTLIQQYTQQQAQVNQQQVPNAPRVMPTSGGVPNNSSAVDLTSAEGRKQRFKELMDAANQSG